MSQFRPDWKSLIPVVPDFPTPGVAFRDLAPLMAEGDAFRSVVGELVAPWRNRPPDFVAGIEARGFVFAAPVAVRLGVGFVPLRKRGRLPPPVERVSYELEYGTDALEVSRDVVAPGSGVLLIDDVLATGGTAEAAIELIAMVGASVKAASFVVNLPFFEGAERLIGLGVEIAALTEF